jgi:type VI secretion system protein ImpL
MFQRKNPKETLTHTSATLKPLQLAVLGLAVFVSILGVGLLLHWQLWQIVIFPTIGLAIVLGGYLLVQRRVLEAETEAARELQKNLYPDQHVADAVEVLRRKWSDALQTIGGTRSRGLGDDPIYKVPWYLVLGESTCGKSSLIKGARPQIPVSQNTAPTENCDWYFFGESILIDTAGRYVHGSKTQDEAEWSELLSLLRQHRKWEPINGVIIAVAADALIRRDANSLRLEATRLRKRLDEIVNRLGVKIPVYLVVTKVDKIAGFAEFFKDLPEQALDQVMGVSDDDFSVAGDSSFFERAFMSICRRLEEFRLGLISLSDQIPVRNSLFTFPGEFKNLQEPLRVYVNTLFLQNPYQEIPGFRGLYFTSASQDGAAISLYPKSLGLQHDNVTSIKGEREYFINNIVSTILSKDRSLVRRTKFWGEELKIVRAGWITAATVGCLAVAGFLLLAYWMNSSRLKNLALQNCTFNAATTVIQSLGEADRCRESIVKLSNAAWWQRPFYGFGLKRIGELESRLKQRFVEGVNRRAISRLDSKVVASMSGLEGPEIAGILARRIKLSTECRLSSECLTSKYKLNQGDYLLLLRTEDPGIKADGPEKSINEGPLGQFQRSYEASLAWDRDGEVLSKYRPDLIKHLTEWIDKDYRWSESTLGSVRSRFKPIEINAFWDGNRKITVDSAYTGLAWNDGVAPLVQALKAVEADLGEAQEELAIFEMDYRNEALRQWERVLHLFSEGNTSVPDTRKEWAFKVMDSNPPEALLEKALENLSKLPSESTAIIGTPRWVKTLQWYQSISKLAETLKNSGKEDKADKVASLSKEVQAAKHLSDYRANLKEIRDQLVTSKESYQSAQAAFEAGAVSEKSKHPIIKAQWNLEQLSDSNKAESDNDDEIVWRVVRLPLALYWKTMLNETGKEIQEQWKSVWVVLPDLYQKPGEKAAKIQTFVTEKGGALLENRGKQYFARNLLDEKVAFTAEFLGHITRLSTYSPEALADLRFPEEIVQLR